LKLVSSSFGLKGPNIEREIKKEVLLLLENGDQKRAKKEPEQFFS